MTKRTQFLDDALSQGFTVTIDGTTTLITKGRRSLRLFENGVGVRQDVRLADATGIRSYAAMRQVLGMLTDLSDVEVQVTVGPHTEKELAEMTAKRAENARILADLKNKLKEDAKALRAMKRRIDKQIKVLESSVYHAPRGHR